MTLANDPAATSTDPMPLCPECGREAELEPNAYVVCLRCGTLLVVQADGVARRLADGELLDLQARPAFARLSDTSQRVRQIWSGTYDSEGGRSTVMRRIIEDIPSAVDRLLEDCRQRKNFEAQMLAEAFLERNAGIEQVLEAMQDLVSADVLANYAASGASRPAASRHTSRSFTAEPSRERRPPKNARRSFRVARPRNFSWTPRPSSLILPATASDFSGSTAKGKSPPSRSHWTLRKTRSPTRCDRGLRPMTQWRWRW